MRNTEFCETLLLKNPSLIFRDAETGVSAKGAEMLLADLPGAGLSEKKLVFLYLSNSLLSLQAYFSYLNTPHALVLLNPALHPDMKKELEKVYLPDFIFDASAQDRDENYTAVKLSDHTFFVLRATTAGRNIHSDIKVLLSTSGTTGSPKFVKLSEKNLLSNATSICQYLPIISADVTPLNLSVFYSYGLSVLHSNCLKGGTIVCTGKDVIQRNFWDDFEKFGYTSLAGVPYVYEMLNRLGFTKKEYPSLRYMTQAGGKLADHLIEIFAGYCRSHQKQFFVMYGQTEATARMAYMDPAYTLEKLGSIGKAIPGGSFEVNPDTHELIYRGDNIFGGYASAPEDLGSFEQPGTLLTGDLARIDDEGFVYITGRAKRFIKLFGTRTNLDETEALLKAKFQPAIFACTGTDDKLVVATDLSRCPEADIKNFIRETLKIHLSVVKLVSVTEMPMTSNGKINYTAIMQLL
jgi:acyl-coenzyme A synthetase/AMP-(fatty) acid ligase